MSKCLRISLVAFLATIGNSLCRAEEPASLVGEWIASAAKSGGKERDKNNFEGMRWIIGKETLEVVPGRLTPAGLAERPPLKCTYIVDNTKTPAHFNWTIGAGDKKTTVDAIYEFKDGVLRIGFAQRGLPRPAGFDAKEGESVYEFKRKPAENP